MDRPCIWSDFFQDWVLNFQELCDWRFLIFGNVVPVSFVNCT
ncbi:hypothetical protein DCAR_0104548 [Daucus carota subsp. sativus]|uniref:Uncharacterized protein n=1 Tax=Daucus carota subsp. sativus TaxID=79200 RepID=A0AAF0WC73_DAUCS|nr:hypothetical protein DCAR_0104548 [Daucus carota subsp. sativus]